MNIRKPVNYTALFSALDALLHQALPQMELYCKIGGLISERPEKGAAVAAAEYLQNTHSDIAGFSPRNVRRMREFYRTYASDAEALSEAMTIGWTLNTVILEYCETADERRWYLIAVRQFRWSKAELQNRIVERVHEHLILDEGAESCYTETEENIPEDTHDKDPFYLPRQNPYFCLKWLKIKAFGE